jgi:Tfp pilus assembly protein PilF
MMKAGEKQKGLEMLEKSAEFSDYKVKEVLEELAKAYRANLQYDNALRIIDEYLIPDSPKSLDLYKEKAEIYDLKGDRVKVVKTYEKLASLNRKNLDAYRYLVEYLASKGYMEKAMEYLFKMEQGVANGDWRNIATILRLHRCLTGDEERAKLLMKEKSKGLLGTKKGFKPKEYLFERAFLLRTDDINEAQICLIDALKQDPSDFNSHLLIARLYRKTGDTVSARFHYQKCIDMDTRNEKVRAEMNELIC